MAADYPFEQRDGLKLGLIELEAHLHPQVQLKKHYRRRKAPVYTDNT